MKTLTRTRALIALGMSAGLLMSHPAPAAPTEPARLERPKKATEEEEPKKSKSSKSTTSRNNDAVKIYPDMIRRSMHVVAKENNSKHIDFFVFDLNGTIVQNFKMKEKDHVKITGLARGKYIYRVFAGDEETASGQFEIK